MRIRKITAWIEFNEDDGFPADRDEAIVALLECLSDDLVDIQLEEANENLR